MSNTTKRYWKLSVFFFWLGILVTFLPIIIFGIKGCLDGTIDIANKLKLGLCFAAALFLTVQGVKSKYNCRSITYLFMLGAYFVVKRIEIVILVCGICCILDEFVIRPLHKYYHNKAVINREIDKRIEE